MASGTVACLATQPVDCVKTRQGPGFEPCLGVLSCDCRLPSRLCGLEATPPLRHHQHAAKLRSVVHRPEIDGARERTFVGMNTPCERRFAGTENCQGALDVVWKTLATEGPLAFYKGAGLRERLEPASGRHVGCGQEKASEQVLHGIWQVKSKVYAMYLFDCFGAPLGPCEVSICTCDAGWFAVVNPCVRLICHFHPCLASKLMHISALAIQMQHALVAQTCELTYAKLQIWDMCHGPSHRSCEGVPSGTPGMPPDHQAALPRPLAAHRAPLAWPGNGYRAASSLEHMTCVGKGRQGMGWTGRKAFSTHLQRQGSRLCLTPSYPELPASLYPQVLRVFGSGLGMPEVYQMGGECNSAFGSITHAPPCA